MAMNILLHLNGANNDITASPMNNGTSTNGNVNTDWPGAFADLHNHSDGSPPSSGDLYKLILVSQNHPGYNTRMVVAPSGVVYALVILDVTLANQFTINNPSQQAPGSSPDFPTDIIDEMNMLKAFNGLTEEMAMAYVLDEKNAGIALLKQDANGNFKRIVTIKNTDANGNTSYTSNNCP